VLTAKTVQVMYDYAAGKPVPIPDAIRALLAST
jgi:acyl-CoA thioesterase FadM